MAQQTINIGRVENDGTGDPLRDALDKINDNFDELYSDRKRTITAPTYTLLTTDDGARLVFTNSGGCTITVPTGLGADFNCEMVAGGADTLLILGDTVILNSANSGYEMMPYSKGWLDATAANIFVLSGTAILEPSS